MYPQCRVLVFGCLFGVVIGVVGCMPYAQKHIAVAPNPMAVEYRRLIPSDLEKNWNEYRKRYSTGLSGSSKVFHNYSEATLQNKHMHFAYLEKNAELTMKDASDLLAENPIRKSLGFNLLLFSTHSDWKNIVGGTTNFSEYFAIVERNSGQSERWGEPTVSLGEFNYISTSSSGGIPYRSIDVRFDDHVLSPDIVDLKLFVVSSIHNERVNFHWSFNSSEKDSSQKD